MSFQDETKARRISGLWQGTSEAHTRRSVTSEQRSQKPERQANKSHLESDLELSETGGKYSPISVRFHHAPVARRSAKLVN